MSHMPPPAVSEQERARFYEWPLYNWVAPLLRRGSTRMSRREKLEPDDLLLLPSFETPSVNAETLRPFWEEEKGRDQPSLIRALRRAFGLRVFVGGLLRFLSDGAAFVSPFVLREIIGWLQDPKRPVYEGFVFIIVLTACNMIMSSALNAGSHNTITGFTQMMTALQVMIYNKALNLPHSHGETGLVTQLHTTDTSRFLEMAMFVHGLWVSPLLVVGATVALYFFIGYAGLFAVGLMIFFVPVQVFLMGIMQGHQREIVKSTDKRLAVINEVFQGIRICKFMNWEERFTRRIFDRRQAEVDVLAKVYSLRTVVTVIINSMPAIVTFVVFASAYALEGKIEPREVFPALSMLNVIRIPVMFIPMSINKLLFLLISIRRLQDFLLRKPLRRTIVSAPAAPSDANQNAAEVANLTVLRSDGEALMKDLTFGVPQGGLTIITGGTGAGKSTLITSMLGETRFTDESRITLRGTVSYVPQEAWIMNATVRQNIIMNLPFDQEKYDRVVEACQLTADFEQLPDGDNTEIGERGINISGGQKQRVAFARAVYSDRDIVVLDDVLSAVDAHVGRALFEKCICGILSTKTRVFVTHHVQYLAYATQVIHLENCNITYIGPPKELDLQHSPESANGSPIADALQSGSAASSPSAKPAADGKVQRKGKLVAKEEMFFGDVSWDVYLWYMKIGRYPWAAALLLSFTLWRISSVLVDLWLAIWSDSQNAFGRSYTGDEYLTFYGIFVAVSILMLLVRSLMYRGFMLSVAQNSHDAMASRVIRAPTWFFDTTPLGRILNRFSKDFDVLDNKLPEGVQMVLNLSFMIMGTIFIVAFAAPYILVIMPILGVIFYNLYVYYSQTMRGVKRVEGVERSPMMAIMSETLGGLSTIRAYNLTEFFSVTHANRAAAAARPPYCQRSCQRWLAARTEMIGSIILFGVGYLSAMSKALGESEWNVNVNPAVAALSLTYAMATTNTITFLTRMMADLESDMSSTERIHEYTHDVPQERDIEYGTEPGQHPKPPAEWPSKGGIVFNKVDLRYRAGLPLVLKEVDFVVSPGSKVGVVGRTGSGKSTLMLTLFRMVEPCGGTIVIDGFDIADVSLADLRRAIVIVPQDPTLFAGSIRSNLDPFNLYKDEDLWDAVAKVGMKERLEQGGLEEEVEERGSNFSVGQRQLLCLARAMLKRCKILLLDEASASISFESDAMIQKVIRTEFKNCTVITIAHRLATIIDADKVVVMADGEVVEHDRPDKLLAQQAGLFRSMVEQLGEEEFKKLQRHATEHFAVSPFQ